MEDIREAFNTDIIWKAIEMKSGKIIGRGRAKLGNKSLTEVLNIYQNTERSIILEIYDPGCTELVMVFKG
jgi:hypothetical protein